jgi:pyruvate,water dikinase
MVCGLIFAQRARYSFIKRGNQHKKGAVIMKNNVAVKREKETKRQTTVKQKATVRVVRGIGASPGIAIGPCRVISELEDVRFVKRGEIVVVRRASPEIAPYVDRFWGIVTEVGGLSTTLAHYAREYEIPHVAGVRDLMSIVTDGQIIRIDGRKGTVSLL